MLLRIDADHEGRDVDELLADTDVALLNEDARVVNRLGKAELKNLCLQATLQEILNLQGQDIIERLLRLIEQTQAGETAEKGKTLENTLRILLIKRQEVPGRCADLGENKLYAPDLTFVAKPVAAHQHQLAVETLSLERTPRRLEGPRAVAIIGHDGRLGQLRGGNSDTLKILSLKI